MEKRPPLNKNISAKDFTDFYWMKAELVDFCKTEGLPKTGSKIAIAQRIEQYLLTGQKVFPTTKKTAKATSKFDWNNEPLSLTTLLTDNYKSTENVRAFFTEQLGKPFKFNVKLMNWMKANTGKTLADALQEWERLKEASKLDTKPKNIAPQFEYNRYIRDFLSDNPDKDRKTAIALWKIIKARRGDNVYRQTDLRFLKFDA